MQYLRLFFLLFLLAACSDDPERGHRAQAATTLSGSVSLVGPVACAEVCAYAFSTTPEPGTALGCTRSDERGLWAMQAGKLHDAVRIEATAPCLIAPLRAVLHQVPQFGHVPHVAVTPVTSLATGYAFYLARTGLPDDAAVAQAQAALNRHFGGIAHESVKPWTPPEASDVAISQLPMVPEVLAYLHIASLEHVARRLSVAAGIGPDSGITLQTLLHALVEDVAADGVFDGVGYAGVRLMQRTQPLTGNTLRLELAIAMAHFVQSEHNVTPLGLPEVEPLVRALAAADGVIFAAAGVFYDNLAPILTGCAVSTERRTASELRYPQRGVIELRCTWQDGHGLVDGDVAVVTGVQDGDETAGQAVRGVRRDGDDIVAIIDTQALGSPAPVIGDFALVLSAENRFGSRAQVSTILFVDNAPLDVEMQPHAHWVSPAKPLQIQGTADKPVRRVSVRAQGALETSVAYDFDEAACTFVVPFEVPCGRSFAAVVSIEDYVGNVVTRGLSFTCDDVPPSLTLQPSTYVHEGDAPGTTDLAQASFPVTLYKDYTRLDYLPEAGRSASVANLPTFVWRVQDDTSDTGGSDDAAVTVDYAFDMDGPLALRRDWQRLVPDDDGLYRLPLSYQTLLPHWVLARGARLVARDNMLARTDATELHHLDVRATDRAGNMVQRRYSFYFMLRAPDVVVSDCGPAANLLDTSLRRADLYRVYTPGTTLFVRHISFRPELPQGSMAPRTSAQVHVQDEPVTTLFTQMLRSRIKRHREDPWHTEGHVAALEAGSASAACALDASIYWLDGGCDAVAPREVYPQQRRYLPSPAVLGGAGVAAITQQPAASRMISAQGMPPAGGQGVYVLEPDEDYEVQTTLGAQVLRTDGRVLDWRHTVVDDGKPTIVFSERSGMHYERFGTMGEGNFFTEIQFIREHHTPTRVVLQQQQLLFHVAPAQQLPTPRVRYESERCQKPMSMAWSMQTDGAQVAPTTP